MFYAFLFYAFGCPSAFFYLCIMFVRQKKNKSGVVSVQIIDKSSGRYKLHKTIGSSNIQYEIDNFVVKANEFLSVPNRF